MGKPTVILADTDENYLAPLEVRFLEQLEDEIELHVITDAAYFKEYFSKPQSVDILIVSEGLYSRSLQKQSIENIFILTEQEDDGTTGDLGVTCLFKYTSIREIYDEVMAACAGKINVEDSKKRETTVALVYSASGGTGKTTLALGISTFLAQSFKKVLYIDAERINSFQRLLQNRMPVASGEYSEFLSDEDDLFERVKHVLRNERFDYLPPFGAALSSLNISFLTYETLIKSAKRSKLYDIIVVDTDSVFDTEKARLVALADNVIMVMNQSQASEFAMKMLMKNMNCSDPEKFHFVCNDFKGDRGGPAGEMKNYMGVPVNEYVDHIENIEGMSLNDLAGRADIQRTAYLVL